MVIFGIAQHLGAAGGFVLEGHAAVVVIHDMAVVEHRRVLVDGGQAAVGEAGQHGGMDRMHMHQAAGMRQGAVDGAVQAPGGGVGRIGAVQGFGIIGVDLDQAGGGDAGEMPAVGVDQKPRALGVHREREVVGHRLVQLEFHRPAEGGGEVDPLGPVGDIGMLVHGLDLSAKLERAAQI